MAKYQVTSPDGQNYEVEAPEDASEQDVISYAQQQFSKQEQPAAVAQGRPENEITSMPLTALLGQPNTPQPTILQQAGKYVANYGRGILNATAGVGLAAGVNPLASAGGVLEAGAALGTGMASPFSAAMANLTQGRGGREVSPDEFTYQPRTQTGRSLLDLLGAATKPVTDSGADVALGPLAMESAAMRSPSMARAAPQQPQAVTAARALGLKLDPRQVIEGQHVGSPVQRAAAVLGGKAAVPADASLLNQPRIQQLVGQDLGLPAGESITPATIDRLRAPANNAYRALGDLKNSAGQPYRLNLARDSQYGADLRKIAADSTSGTARGVDPAVATLLEKYPPINGVELKSTMKDVADLRFDASKHFKSDDPALVRQARAERAISDALENSIDRQLGARQSTKNVVDDWRAARVQLAKLHTVEDSLVGTEIDARLLAKAEDSGAKLSGNMQKLASAARNFSTSMQTGANLGSKSSLGLFDVGAAGVGGTLGALVGGVPGALLGMAAEPAVRLGSKKIALGPGYGVRKPSLPDSSFIARYILSGAAADETKRE